MKAEELMVGDLLRVNRDHLGISKGTIVEVRAIDADTRIVEKGLIGCTHCHPMDEDQFDCGIWCAYLDPIPLTPEILLKNGFKHDGMCSWEWQEIHYDGYHRVRKYIKVTPPDPDNEWKSPEDSGFIVSTNLREVNLEDFQDVSVHHLNRFLRLCGIDKTIEL